MLGKICALGRKTAKQVRVVVLYSKDFGSGLPFYSQRAVWEPCTDRKGNHVKQNQKKKYMSVKQNKAHILCTKPATLVAEWEQVEVEGEEKKKKLKITLLELFYIVINIIRLDIQTLWFTSTSSQCNVYRLPPWFFPTVDGACLCAWVMKNRRQEELADLLIWKKKKRNRNEAMKGSPIFYFFLRLRKVIFTKIEPSHLNLHAFRWDTWSPAPQTPKSETKETSQTSQLIGPTNFKWINETGPTSWFRSV